MDCVVYTCGSTFTGMRTNAERLEAALAIQLKVELLERGMTQQDLAAKVGMGRPAINHYLNAQKSMTVATLDRIAGALGLSVAELMTRAVERRRQDEATA